MGKYFKGWRRKIGVVTLLAALVLTGMWAFSNVRTGINWFSGIVAIPGSSEAVGTSDGEIVWYEVSEEPWINPDPKKRPKR
jgi:hypothetical protein